MVSLRQMTVDDGALLRDIRLLALSADPRVFGSSFAKEKEYDAAIWRSWLEDADVAIFGLFDDADAVAGMTAISLSRDDPARRTAKLWGSWMRPDLRGRGFSELFYRARIDWARRHPEVEKIIVSHRASNIASMKANQKHGFIFTHRAPHIWPDGAAEDQLFYELVIKKTCV